MAVEKIKLKKSSNILPIQILFIPWVLALEFPKTLLVKLNMIIRRLDNV